MAANARTTGFAALCSAAVLMAGCAHHRFDPARVTAADVSLQLPPPGSAPVPAAQFDYRIAPFDKLSVKAFGVPDLDREGVVDAGGNFTMPLVGTQHVAGLPAEAVARQFEQAYAGRYLKRPQFSVNVLESASAQVTVEGGVARPGAFPVAGSTTLLRAIAVAGSPTERGVSRDVLVFRQVDGRRMVARFDLDAVRGGQAVDPPIYGNDLIVVRSANNSAFFRNLVALAPFTSLFYLIFR